jgi:hypothetical protein
MRLSLILLFAGLALLPQQQPNSTVKRNNPQNTTTGETAPQPPVVISNTVNCEPTKEAKQAETSKAPAVANDWRGTVNAWSTLIIAVFTAITVIVLRSQINTTHNLVRPGAVVKRWDGPDALITTLDIVPSSEGNYVSFVYEFENRGRTPARITDGKMYFTISEKLPAEPYFGEVSKDTRPEEIPPDGRFMPPVTENDPPLVLRQIYRGPNSFLLTLDEKQRIKNGELFYCCYACLWYTDIFSRKHETRVCYVWHSPDNLDPFNGFRLAGPDAYNRHT